jgi:opacity protein-like surface antigen
MRSLCAVCCVLLLAGCASQPAAPAFHAPRAADETAAAPDSQPLALEGASDTGAGAAAVTHAQGSTVDELSDRHVTALVGARKVDDNTADNLGIDEQFMLGLGVDMSDPQTGNGFEAGFEGSGDDGTKNGQDVELHLFDIYGGYRKTFHPQDAQVHPYLAGGLAVLHGELDVGPDDDDTTLGAYVRAGISVDVSEKVRLGVDYRHMFADLDFFGDNFDADFNQLALSIGFPF